MFNYDSHFYYDNGLKIYVEQELLDYYFWHIRKATYNCLKLQKPAYGGHISVILPNIHGEEKSESSKKYIGERVSFSYDNEIIQGGSAKGFKNFFVKVECQRANQIKEELKIVEEGFLGLHFTICSNKSEIKNKTLDIQPKT